jgi:hypothetical protein
LGSPTSLTQKTKKLTNKKYGGLRLFRIPKSRDLNLSSHTISRMFCMPFLVCKKHMKNYEKYKTSRKTF